MGQFASRAFDGDPYIEIMRVLPDKELCWWIQKVIWLAEGFTVLDHFGRTYPRLMLHKCEHCNGAGTVICSHCSGYKVMRATSHDGFRLSDKTTVGRLLATAGSQECQHCGTYCPWDAESEWQGQWEEWESKLAYYNRSYGQIMDNWYDDVVNEGNLDEDTHQSEEPAPPPEVTGIFPDLDREAEKMPKRLAALMKRFGGHPYQTFDMIPFQIFDPTKPLDENIDRLGLDYNWLPPEMDPQSFPEYLLTANSPIKQLEHQIRMEYLLLNNLDAAIKDEPKPAMFGPAAGTVLCPGCHGEAHHLSFTPNINKLFRMEPPFWMRTLSRMHELGTWDVSAEAYRRRPKGYVGSAAVHEEEERAAAGTSSSTSDDASSRASRQRWGEVPSQPCKDVDIQAAVDSAESLGRSMTPYAPRPEDWGPMDPLSSDPFQSVQGRDQVLGDVLSKANPITGSAAAEASWKYHSLNPAKNLARQARRTKQQTQSSGTAQAGQHGGQEQAVE